MYSSVKILTARTVRIIFPIARKPEQSSIILPLGVATFAFNLTTSAKFIWKKESSGGSEGWRCHDLTFARSHTYDTSGRPSLTGLSQDTEKCYS